MKKSMYYITTKNSDGIKYQTVVGYVFKQGGCYFGVSNKKPNGSTRKYWSITHLKTGMLCGYVDKKSDASRFLSESTPEFWELLKNPDKHFISMMDKNDHIIEMIEKEILKNSLLDEVYAKNFINSEC